MKLNLVCTSDGFKVADDTDYEQKRRLKIGKTYEVTIRELRNYLFLKKYFALINCAWDCLNEGQQDFFHNDRDCFRKTAEVAAGHCERVYSLTRREWLEVPLSIAFDKLDETQFSSLYERVKDVIYTSFIPEENMEAFEENLQYY